MKISKNVAWAAVIVVVLVVSAVLTAQYGEELMGRMKKIMPGAGRGNWQWWCKNIEQATGEVGGDISGGESNPSSSSSSSFKFSFGSGGFSPHQKNPFYGFEPKLAKEGSESGSSDFSTPNDKPGEEESYRSITCKCPVYDPPEKTYLITTEEFASKYGGSEEAFCKEMEATDLYCKDPKTLSCYCEAQGGVYLETTMSQYEFDEFYDGDMKKACNATVTFAYTCNPYYICPTGKELDGAKIWDKCLQGNIDAKKNQCGGGSYKIDSSLKKVCNDFNFYFDYLENAPCVTKDDCKKYKDVFDASGVEGLKETFDEDGVGYDVGYSCWNLYGIDVPTEGGKGWGE